MAEEIREITIPNAPICLTLYDTEKCPSPISYVLISVNDKGTALIWQIYTRKEFTHKGYATLLIDILKKRYNRIETQFETREGRELLLANDFLWKKAIHKNKQDLMVWENYEPRVSV